VGSEIDPVELALAIAFERASAAGQWPAVELLARELKADDGRAKAHYRFDAERRKAGGMNHAQLAPIAKSVRDELRAGPDPHRINQQ
jgi:hypothetical protein